MKICSKCGCENNDNASFCNNCGADISGNPQQEPKGNPDLMTTCPACGEPVSTRATTCPHCGLHIHSYNERIKEQQRKENPKETAGDTLAGIIGFICLGFIFILIASVL